MFLQFGNPLCKVLSVPHTIKIIVMRLSFKHSIRTEVSQSQKNGKRPVFATNQMNKLDFLHVKVLLAYIFF